MTQPCYHNDSNRVDGNRVEDLAHMASQRQYVTWYYRSRSVNIKRPSLILWWNYFSFQKPGVSPWTCSNRVDVHKVYYWETIQKGQFFNKPWHPSMPLPGSKCLVLGAASWGMTPRTDWFPGTQTMQNYHQGNRVEAYHWDTWICLRAAKLEAGEHHKTVS